MKRNIIILSAAVILITVAAYSLNSYNAGYNAETKPNKQSEQKAPVADSSAESKVQNKINLMEDYDFALEDLKGNKVALSDFKGKKVFLNFWATSCFYCKEEMPDMEKLYQETKNTDLVILAVNAGDDKKTVQDFIEKNNYNFTVLLDVKGEVSLLYQVTGIPASYFIDTKGFLDDGTFGAIPLESMKNYVNNLD